MMCMVNPDAGSDRYRNHVDDMTTQNIGYVTDRLLDAGASDVLTIPVQMKKRAPGPSDSSPTPLDRTEALSRIFH
jgi:pyridinium-3,5-bisthiocarboxylic acid mononucleotide nickel chelatase